MSVCLLTAIVRRARRWAGLILLGILAVTALPASAQEVDFLDPEDAFVLSASMATPTQLTVQFAIAPDYYMYRAQFRFSTTPAGAWLGEPVFPQGKIKYDPTFDEELEVYTGRVRIALPLYAGATEALTLEVVSQGCAEAGLCYAPMHTQLHLTPTMAGYELARAGAAPALVQAGAFSATLGDVGNSPASFTALADGGDVAVADFLGGAGLWQIVLAGLFLGVLLSFTPCVLPMVPILLSLIAGSAHARAGTRARGSAGHAANLRLALLYVFGSSVVYTALGVAAGLAGASLAAWLQTPWVLALFAALLGVLALAMFGVFQFQAPLALQAAVQARLARIPGGHAGGAFLMGMLSALIVGPCVAAPLAGVLLFISATGDVWQGGLALFALAWGQGVLLLILGASSGAWLPKAGAWMERVQHGFGVLLLATAWWMLMPVLPAVVLILGWVVLAFWAALILGALRPLPTDAGAGRLLARALGYVSAAWGLILLVGLATGGRDALRPLDTLVQSVAPAPTSLPTFTRIDSVADLNRALARAQQPVVLDFYADWCIACKEMERFTFKEPEVARRLAQFTLLQVDVTRDTADDRALLQQFRLFGPPGMVFFDGQGQLLPQTRVIGFQNAARFVAVLDRVLDGTAR